jgi:hypothetical protein
MLSQNNRTLYFGYYELYGFKLWYYNCSRSITDFEISMWYVSHLQFDVRQKSRCI